uniref:methylmalonic aciduria type A protein, mitochondrial n=1 Tax=Ciona intestinalis TaxID=7719 RepID=UPI000180B8C1|nr:methylmalonic aciduria type A protein, mitochondrial [Ciona intestinalis]|eukprot:XP_002131117.1 methylmalonic aciduria type A protein, mitochondrial [Ciona intestinalis]
MLKVTSFRYLSVIHTRYCYSLLLNNGCTLQQRNNSSSFKTEQFSEYLKNSFETGSYENRTIEKLFNGICSKQRSSLAEAITLVESNHEVKKKMSQVLLQLVLQKVKTDGSNEKLKRLVPSCVSSSLRIGITGPPGAGKSMFIEKFGMYLTRDVGLKVAVLAVDPSSKRTGGSLLGDKTRMSMLSVEPNAYVRPSPSSGELGGVARNTMEAIQLCEGAGYDVIIVETVGVGQSEVAVGDMTDIFTLIIPPAGGDELQGLKRGIIENCDIIMVNKSDGDLIIPARKIQTEYTSALKFIPRKHKVWRPRVTRISALTNTGIAESWKTMMSLFEVLNSSGIFLQQRRDQTRAWMWSHLRNSLEERFKNNPLVQTNLPDIMDGIEKGEIPPGLASDILVDLTFNKD